MPGIFGLVDLTETEDLEHAAGKMARALCHQPASGGLEMHSEGGLALGRVALGRSGSPQIVANEDGSVLVAMDGEVFGYESVRAELQRRGVSFRTNSAAEFVLRLYETKGRDFAEPLNGAFAIAIWDRRTRSLLLANDRFGLRPLFWRSKDGMFAFASEVKGLLDTPHFTKRINHWAISDLITFGFLLGSKTLFEDISLLPSASVLTFNEAGVSIHTYWDLRYRSEADRGAGCAERCVEEFADLLLRAVERFSEPGVVYGVPLSGGIDSRLIAVALHYAGRQERTFTLGEQRSRDRVIASEVARLLDVPHEIVQVASPDFLKWIPEAVWLSDGMLNCVHSHILWLARQIQGEVGVVFDGMEPLDGFYSKLEVLLKSRGLKCLTDEKLILRIFPYVLLEDLSRSDLKIDDLYAPAYYPQTKDYRLESLRTLANGYPDPDGSFFDRLDYLANKHRRRRFSSLGGLLLRSRVEVRNLFYDQEVIDFITRLPDAYRSNDKYLFRKTLKLLNPTVARIPWERTGIRPDVSRARLLMNAAWRYGKRKSAKRLERMFGVDLLHWTGSGCINYQAWFRTDAKLRRSVWGLLLSPESIVPEYFRARTVERLLTEQFERRGDHLELIGRLLTLELWHRLFIRDIDWNNAIAS